jgi:hypothetical protein
VTYTQDWEPLADALKRVVATNAGASKDEAKVDLCRALADRKIRIRVRVVARTGLGAVFSNGNVEVPPHLTAADLDWTASRPFEPWPIGPKLGEHYSWIGGWENKRIDLIEVSTADLIEVLCHGCAPEARPALQQPTHDAPSPDPDVVGGTKEQAVLKAIDQIWPGGIPMGLSSKTRNEEIYRQIKNNGGSPPHQRTIERALKARRIRQEATA